MTSVELALILLLAVVLSGPLARLTRLPLPIIQIAVGTLIALAGVRPAELQPQVFFLLFLPPLLFLDGWRIPKGDLFRNRDIILELALGLVVFTVLGLGWMIHAMIPAIPLAVCFALAAVLSPTDPTAVSAIAARVPIPTRMMRILQGESLLNDASGLVCMQFAVAAALTGVFSLPMAFATFVWLAAGGLAIGAVLTWSVIRLANVVAIKLGQESGSRILLSLLIPFGAYLLANDIGCSGILAAVAAGITMSYAEQTDPVPASTRMRGNAVWDAVQFTTNGVMFVLLGEQLPRILSKSGTTVQQAGHQEVWWLAGYVLAISAGLAILRFIWVWTSLRLTLFWSSRRAARGRDKPFPRMKLILAISVAGVRGAVTLAGVLTLPLVMTDGSPFPGRDLAILLAAGVILALLFTSSLGLPWLLKGLKFPPDPSSQRQEDSARIAAAEAAIQAVERSQHEMADGREDADLYTSAAARLMEVYRQRIERCSHDPAVAEIDRRTEEIDRRLRLIGLRAERDEILSLIRKRKVEGEAARRLIREIDFAETRYSV